MLLSSEEQALYKTAHATASGHWETFKRLGPNECNKHLLQIMSMLLPMRKASASRHLMLMSPWLMSLSQSQLAQRRLQVMPTGLHPSYELLA